MSNEEKILSKLNEIQTELEVLKYDVSILKSRNLANELKNETPEERKKRQMAAFHNFVNSTTDDEEPEKTAEFFRIMEAEKVRKARIS